MPRRTDLESILIVGSGPIVIGQACEFDYSGTQACKALTEEGFRVVLLNSNPATIMTDPEFAHRTYVEPMTVESLEAIIARERPDALLPTLGGQTALNLAVEAAENGVLERHGVELIGASLEAILKAEDRDRFRRAMEGIGLLVPASGHVGSLREARELLPEVGLPAIVRPSFTLGGAGAGVATTEAEFERVVDWGLRQSPRRQCLVEQSVLGWKEFELEVMRDGADNVVIICSIENLDPMGVHTGDSITVAPAQTLTDKEYQAMRDAAIAIIREIGVDTGGSNIQFAVDPDDGTQVVIEMNPRVSRSSALASKATGFPIAKIAALLAVGYRLDEIRNDITRETPASFEPTIDYVVTKIPRFTFEKFPGVDDALTTQMKSVGEAMGIGRTFVQSLQKAIRSLEIDRYGLEVPAGSSGSAAPGIGAGDGTGRASGEAGVVVDDRGPRNARSTADLVDLWDDRISTPRPDRLWYLAEAFRRGESLEELHRRSRIDPWFLAQIHRLVEAEIVLERAGPGDHAALLRSAKEMGFSDRRLAQLWGVPEERVRALRRDLGVQPVYKRVDTCAAEFEAYTPYLYSAYEEECEAAPTGTRKVIILGGGPNRIGQGIEFDTCCVHAAFALQEVGIESIMVNCNPETVSTDYDTSDRLYFEPLTLEDVLEIVDRERPEGVIVQFGGQTPLRLSVPLERAGVTILGTSPDAIDRAEDRERFDALLEKLELRRPPSGMARSEEEAAAVAERIGYPVLVRPSYVLGGRAMEIVDGRRSLHRYMRAAVLASPEHPVLVDRFLADAIEVDVDAVADGERVVVGGVMEHIEEAGVHSGDSACTLPPRSLGSRVVDEILDATRRLALELGVRGLMNVQYAVKEGEVFVLEVNPRASRTVPFVSKAIGVPLAKVAARVMVGESLEEIGFTEEIWPEHVSVKAPVFPFVKFPGVDPLPGPEMKSTGEVMGIGGDFRTAYGKALLDSGVRLPREGTVLVSVREVDHPRIVESIRELSAAGFAVLATEGTAVELAAADVRAEVVPKVGEGHPNVVERIEAGDVDLVINTVEPQPKAVRDSASIRRAALHAGCPYFTTLAAARTAVGVILGFRREAMEVRSLQEIQAPLAPSARSPGSRDRR